MTTKLLANQLQSILADPVEGFTVELADESTVYEWKVYIEGPKDTCYEGGVFQLLLSFPKDYPMNPPVLKFISEFWHPNVYSDGKVCMSILHPPGDDSMSGELARERWLPTQSVTTIILSLLSLLNDPNCSSPANVDASVEWRKNREGYVGKCKRLVEKANREKPAHVVIPHPDTNEEEHKRVVQKWKEMNKGLDYEDFYEHNEEADDDDDEDEDEDEDDEEEDELSNSEINEDDDEDEKKNKTSETSKDDKETKQKDVEITTSASTTQIPASSSSSSSSSVSLSVPPSSSASSSVPTPSVPPSSSVPSSISPSSISPSSDVLPPSDEKQLILEEGNSSSNNNNNKEITEEISPDSASSNPRNNSGPNNGPNSPNEASGGKQKKGKSKNKKKCIIM